MFSKMFESFDETTIISAFMRLLDVVGKLGYLTFNVILVVCVILVSVNAFMNFDDWRKGRVSSPLSDYVKRIDSMVVHYNGDVIELKILATERYVQCCLKFSKKDGNEWNEMHIHLSDLGKVLGYIHVKYPEKQFTVHDFFKKISL